MATTNAIQNAIAKVKKMRSDAEKARNRKLIEETNKIEAGLQKQLVIARWEEKNLKLKQEQAAVAKRIAAAREKQKGHKYGSTEKTLRQIGKISKQIGKRLGL
jgi:hypothetical protein